MTIVRTSHEMASNESRFTENLPQLAADSFKLAQNLCDYCQTFHSVWPYLRLARISGAIEAGRTELERVLLRSFRNGSRRVLIAGAADTGILALVARTGFNYSPEIVVLDRCLTPLELCRRFSQRWSVPIKTIQKDLIAFDDTSRFDTIIAHSILQFISPNDRGEVLARLGGALFPRGEMLQIFNVGRRISPTLQDDYREHYAEWVLNELELMNLPLPERNDLFRHRLADYARERETREGSFACADEMDALLKDARLVVRYRLPIELNLAASHLQFASKLSKQRFLVVAGKAG